MNNQYGRDDQKQISDDSWTRFWEALSRLQEDKSIVLMQFTGLTDMDGKEIYEGDIVRDADGIGDRVMEIEFRSDSACFTMKSIPNMCWLAGTHRYVRVIGNIHEDADLLQQPS